MAESKFKQLQEEVCYKEPEEIPEPEKAKQANLTLIDQGTCKAD